MCGWVGAIVGVSSAVVLLAAIVLGREAWPEGLGESPVRITASVEAVRDAVARRPLGNAMRVAVVGDVQNGLSELAVLLDAVRAAEPDLILLLGDCVNRPLDGRYAALRSVIRRHAPGIPLLAVPGNHDVDEQGSADTYVRWMGPTTWELDLDGWRILGLDDATGILTPASLELLERAASEPPARGLILAAHRPIGGPADNVRDERRLQVAETGVLPHTRLTLQGHTHRSAQTIDEGGVCHVLMGANCDRSSHAADTPVEAYVIDLVDGALDLSTLAVARSRRIDRELRSALISHVYPLVRRARRALSER